MELEHLNFAISRWLFKSKKCIKFKSLLEYILLPYNNFCWFGASANDNVKRDWSGNIIVRYGA
jgi:hypothetical protein